jgi:hypothetical protein
VTDTREKLDDLGSSVLENDGELAGELRRAVEARSVELGGRPAGNGGDVPDELVGLVEKVALHAYKTTVSDIDRLKQAGLFGGCDL